MTGKQELDQPLQSVQRDSILQPGRDSIIMTLSAYQVWGTTWAQGEPAESES